MIQKMLLSLNFGNSLIKRNLYLLPGMENQYRFIFPAVIALSISGLVCLLAFSMYVWRIRSGSIFLLLLLSLMVLMVVFQLLVRSWYRSGLICYGCTEFMRALNVPILL